MNMGNTFQINLFLDQTLISEPELPSFWKIVIRVENDRIHPNKIIP